MTMEEKIELLEEIMDVDEGTLSPDTVLEEVEEWDSLSKLSLIATAKREFGIVLKAELLRTFVTVQDICDFLK